MLSTVNEKLDSRSLLIKNNFCRKRLARLLKPNRSFQVNTNDNENLKEILLKTTPNLVRQSQSSAQQIVIEELNDKETKTIWELISFQLMKNFNCKFEINPLNQPYYFWLIVISLCYLYNLIFLIARTAFWLLQDGAMSTWFFFDYFVSDFVYILDVLIRFNTGYMENGEICMDKLKIFKKYIKTFQFKIDVLSIFPIEIFSFLLFPENESRFKVALRLNRLLRFGRFFEFRSITETQTKYPTVFRMSNLILNILIAMHWNGCIYFLISNFLGFGSDSWVFPTLTSPNITLNLTSAELHNMLLTHELGTQYIYCFWWSVQTLSTIAEVPPPTTYYEEIYMTILLMIGVVILAITIGSAGDMVENANRQKLELQQKCDYAKSFLNQHRITGTLEMRVKNYLNYLWITSDANLADDLGTLPSNLRKAIAMDVHMDTLKRVHVFQDCEPGLLGELVTKLKLQIYSPGDYVCRKGDVGHEMYFIKTGQLQVVSPDGNQVFATLGAGAAFGEISILDIPGNKNGNKRTANIRSLGFSNLYSLSKDDLWEALSEYPLAKKSLLEKGKALLKKDNLLDEQVAEEIEQKQKPIHEQIDYLNHVKLRSLVNKLEDIFKIYTDFLRESKNSLCQIEKVINSKENDS